MATLILFVIFSIVLALDDFTVHIFKVGQADSQLIQFGSGYTILIDLGENRDDTEPTNAKYVESRLEELLPSKRIDVLILSHVHLDHFGYVERNSGIHHLIESGGYTVGKYIGRDIGVFNGDGECNSSTIDWKYVGEYEEYNVNWICYAHNLKTPGSLGAVRELAQMCSTTQIAPPDKNVAVEIVIADALFALKQDGNPVASNWANTENAPSENDYSISLRIQVGDFVYFTGGDLDGMRDFSYGMEISNEEELIKDVVGSVDVYRVNHHGDYHSSIESFIGTMKPTVGVVSCGENNRYQLPHTQTIARLSVVCKTIFLTENCNSETAAYGNFYPMKDDVVLRYKLNSDTFDITNSDSSYIKTFTVKKNKNERKKCSEIGNRDIQIVVFLFAVIILLF
ncbi:hypothetical protein EIN_186340 [Entamoeba invadens IP1]|uniref:hypothetical protein n=1 Tax=Entamoeba invadens IP1 TaxID=370355 RepID=UPI0002C3EE1B|nr:hypothetical protein EIN_186340 [Entamoeba invadens IP1]ELP94207.1 hypothetical protein EIN_186340 [Entamoeba invadens IP1]|eukprot:XP_004260978.1 hypothetical protein EIN_186340 [Entamoeba invadens IP1]